MKTLFCLKCGRRVDLVNDIRAVELQGNQGALCGDDVDNLIAEIWTPWRGRTVSSAPPGTSHHSHRLPGEPRGEML